MLTVSGCTMAAGHGRANSEGAIEHPKHRVLRHRFGIGNIRTRPKKTQPSDAEQSADRALLEKSAQLAMVVGTAAVTVNTLEPWLALNDFTPVHIQLAVALALVGLTGLSCTDWGGRRRLALFTFGFLLAIAGFLHRILEAAAICSCPSQCSTLSRRTGLWSAECGRGRREL
jgi:hypothetical protein